MADLQKLIIEKQKEVAEKLAVYLPIKDQFKISKADWQSAVSDLEDLNRQQKALTDGK